MSACYIDTQLTELAHTLSAEQDREEAIERYSDAVRTKFDVQALGEALAAADNPFPLIEAIKAGFAGGIEEEITALLAEHMHRAAA